MTETTTALSVEDILTKAADVIDTNGYHKRYLYDTGQADGGTPVANCRVDIIGAINIALYGTPRHTGAGLSVLAEQALTDRIDAPSVVAWCDLPGHGKTEAIALLRDTAAAHRETP